MNHSEAVWAAQLHVKKGTLLSAEAVLEICKELVARAELDHPMDYTFRNPRAAP